MMSQYIAKGHTWAKRAEWQFSIIDCLTDMQPERGGTVRDDRDRRRERERWSEVSQEIYDDIRSSDDEEQTILQSRNLKFGTRLPVQSNENSVPRREVNAEFNPMLQFEPATLIMYGVELMQEQDIQKYFAPLCLGVQFLDESHCAVRFLQPSDFFKAFYDKLENKRHVGDLRAFETSLTNKANRIKWRPLEPYTCTDYPKALSARLMTNMDRLHTDPYKHDKIIQEMQTAKDRSVFEAKAKRQEEKGFGRSRSRERRSFKYADASKYFTNPTPRGMGMREMVRKQKKFWEDMERMMDQQGCLPRDFPRKRRSDRNRRFRSQERDQSCNFLQEEIERLKSKGAIRTQTLRRDNLNSVATLDRGIIDISRVEETEDHDESREMLRLLDQMDKHGINEPQSNKTALVDSVLNSSASRIGRTNSFEDSD